MSFHKPMRIPTRNLDRWSLYVRRMVAGLTLVSSSLMISACNTTDTATGVLVVAEANKSGRLRKEFEEKKARERESIRQQRRSARESGNITTTYAKNRRSSEARKRERTLSEARERQRIAAIRYQQRERADAGGGGDGDGVGFEVVV